MSTLHASKENLRLFQSSWNELKEKLTTAFSEKNTNKNDLMREAIELYHSFINTFSKDDSIVPNNGMDIRPLNDVERLRFIEGKMSGSFAFIQLEALFSEAMKKAASQLAMRKQ